MFNTACPYCGNLTLNDVTPNRVRPETHTLKQCSGCQGHSIKHANGIVYPLNDRTDPDGDAVNRVVD